jgi:uncharacterized repeat protein (TIGR04138 family)
MLETDFAAAVENIVRKDSRFDKDAYFFLREVLEQLTSEGKKHRVLEDRHVTGQQLLEAIRKVALEQFGPMVPTVFETWGLACGEDFGDMVYSLIDAGFFRKSPKDSRDDFKGGYSFHEAFVVPFLPSTVPAPKMPRVRRRETKPIQH